MLSDLILWCPFIHSPTQYILSSSSLLPYLVHFNVVILYALIHFNRVLYRISLALETTFLLVDTWWLPSLAFKYSSIAPKVYSACSLFWSLDSALRGHWGYLHLATSNALSLHASKGGGKISLSKSHGVIEGLNPWVSSPACSFAYASAISSATMGNSGKLLSWLSHWRCKAKSLIARSHTGWELSRTPATLVHREFQFPWLPLGHFLSLSIWLLCKGLRPVHKLDACRIPLSSLVPLHQESVFSWYVSLPPHLDVLFLCFVLVMMVDHGQSDTCWVHVYEVLV